jgi:hypothetical protein
LASVTEALNGTRNLGTRAVVYDREMKTSLLAPLAAALCAISIVACGGAEPARPLEGTPTQQTREATPTAAAIVVASATAVPSESTPVTPPTDVPIPAPTSTPTPSVPGVTGVAGTVLVGPQCPVVRQDEPCPDRPLEATIMFLDEGGQSVASVRSGTDGRFFVALQPGVYRIVPEDFGRLPHASESSVTVTAGQVAEVIVSYDSGIR